VALRVVFQQANTIGDRPIIMVRVGNGPRVPVILDTGSTGLHIFTQGVHTGRGSGVTVTSKSNKIEYLDGSVQSGVVAKAKLTIGGLTTRRPVSFGLINKFSCVRTRPVCPGMFGIPPQVAAGDYGIMGVGLVRSRTGFGNPLLNLPGRFGKSWSISLSGGHGKLILGAHLPTRATRFRLRRDGTDPGGAPAWNDAGPYVCWGSEQLHGDSCIPTVFDTGTATMLWFGKVLGREPTVPGSTLVNPGSFIAAWPAGTHTAFWSFTVGTRLSHDAVFAFRSRKSLVVASVEAFYSFEITYDDADGEVLLARR
jgi:hypothetical protein